MRLVNLFSNSPFILFFADVSHSFILFLLLFQNLGLQLEYILAREHADRLSVIDDIKDDNRRKELRAEDEEEDFLDEGRFHVDCFSSLLVIVNPC
jgi:hypothetical protein